MKSNSLLLTYQGIAVNAFFNNCAIKTYLLACQHLDIGSDLLLSNPSDRG